MTTPIRGPGNRVEVEVHGLLTARRQWSLLLALSLLATLLPAGLSSSAAPALATGGIDRVCTEAPSAHFGDAAAVSPTFVDAVDCLAAYGITRGDAQGDFRPGASVTRQQMALFLVRFLAQAETGGIEPPARAGSDDRFDDLDGLSVEARQAANLLAERGIARGAQGGASFAPGLRVTRGQMASFMVRALLALDAQLPLVPDDGFPDVPTEFVHASAIGTLAALQVVRGYPDGRYGPADPVTREQMAAFLLRSAEVLAAQDRWQGRFLSVDPVPVPEPETPEPIETGPETPTDPTPSMVLAIDGNERVVGATLTVTVRLLAASGSPLDAVGITWALYARDDYGALPAGNDDPAAPPRLDLSRALALGPALGADRAPHTDAEGRVDLWIPTAGLPTGRHVVVVWGGPPGLVPLDGALAHATVPVELTAPAEEQTTFVATATLATDTTEGPHLLVSDGTAVTALPASSEARYRIQGIPVSRARFLEQARAGDQLWFSTDSDGSHFRLEPADVPTAGMIEVHDGVRFVEPVSGVALSDDLDELLSGQLYEIDGEPVGERRFRRHLSTGDHLRIEVVDEGGGTEPDLLRHVLEDRGVSGEVVVFADGVAWLDPNPDDDFAVGPAGLGSGLRLAVVASVPNAPVFDTNTYRVDDAAPTNLAGFVSALEALLAPWGGRGTLEYDRRAGEATYHLTTVPPPPFVEIGGIIVDGDTSAALVDPPGPWTLDLAVGEVRRQLSVVAEPRAVIDGLLSTSRELLDAVSIGDLLTCQGVDREGACTQLRLTRASLQARIVFVDLEELEVDLLLDHGYVLERVDLRDRAFGVRGDRARFRIEEQDFDGTLAELLAEVAPVDLDVHEVRVRLQDQGIEGAYVWVIDGLPRPDAESS